jgi:hypothetical protein
MAVSCPSINKVEIHKKMEKFLDLLRESYVLSKESSYFRDCDKTSNGIPVGQENIGIDFSEFQQVLKIYIVNWILHTRLSETPWLGLQIITFPIHNFCLFSIPDFSEKPSGVDAKNSN